VKTLDEKETEKLPEDSGGESFKSRLKKGILAEKLIVERLERRGWIISKRGLGAGSEGVLPHSFAKSHSERFKADYHLLKNNPYGPLEVEAEFKGSLTGDLWINKYQFERMSPDVLIIAVDLHSKNIYCALKENLEKAPHEERQRPGYGGPESRAVLVFQFKDMKLLEEVM